MKTTIVLLLILLGFLYWTNPTLGDFSEFAKEYSKDKIEEELGDTPVGNAIASIVGSGTQALSGRIAKHDDYYFFSIFTLGGVETITGTSEEVKVIGFVKTLVPLDEPESWDFVGDAKANSVFD